MNQSQLKVSINILGFNEKNMLERALSSIFEQDYPNYEVTYIDNASSDGSAEYVKENFPNVKVIQTGENKHYGPAHNIGFAKTDSEFVCVLNSDLNLAKNYISECVKVLMSNPKVGGVQGKTLRPKPVNGKYIIDGTGLIINRARLVRDRGQLEVDNGQYDTPEEVFAVCGSNPVYRRAALQDIAINGEIIDEDIRAFFDDTDLGWRMRHQGWIMWYQPTAISYHERGFGQSPTGYRKLWTFIKFRKKIGLLTKQLSWKNKFYVVIKNDFGRPFWRDLPVFLWREFLHLGFITLFETKTLTVLPLMFKQLPKIFRKRRIIKSRSLLGRDAIDHFIEKDIKPE